MNKSKLIKEAIADAKSLQSIALANAKQALQEAFTPQLQSMLSSRLQQEMEGDDEEYEDEEVAGEEGAEEELDELNLDTTGTQAQIPADEELEEDAYEDEEELPAEEMLDEEEMEELPAEEAYEDDEDLELEAILKEMEDDGEEEAPEEDEDLELEAILKEMDDNEEEEEAPAEEEAEDEDLELEAILKEIEDADEDEEAPAEEEMDEALTLENKRLKLELKASTKAITELRTHINEVKLLNAKLLFTHKLFKSGTLSESKKVRIIEQFDKAKTLNEAKLVYETIKASVDVIKTKQKGRVVTEGASRKVLGRTAPKKKLVKESKENELRNRFMHLANINVNK